MRLNKEARELLDRYLLGVKRELSGPDREDITAEIESYLFDTLEERYPKMEEVDKDTLTEVLREMGAPRKVASQYASNRYLIGPRFYPIYLLVLKILAAVVTGALTLSTAIGLIFNGTENVWLTILEYLGSVWSGVLTAGAVVTLIFAVIERATEGKEIDEIKELEDLKINDLPELPEEDNKYSALGTSIEIVFGVIGLAFLTYLQNSGGLVPYITNPSSPGQTVQFFTDNFVKFIPVMIAFTGLDLGRNIVILVQGRHSSLTNWWHIVTESANVVFMGFLIAAMPLIRFDCDACVFANIGFDNLEGLANTGLTIALALGMLGSTVDVIRKTIKELRNPAF